LAFDNFFDNFIAPFGREFIAAEVLITQALVRRVLRVIKTWRGRVLGGGKR
jgi:hypothetical protein